jgi:surface carbohydrate biosynthesis protein
MNSIFKKILIVLDMLNKTKFVFSSPKESSILVFDSKNSICLYDYLDGSKVTSFEPLFIELNIFILFRSLIFRTSYFQSYVDYVRPKLLLTFIDNAMQFLYLKCPQGCKKVTVQNGYRSAVHHDLYHHFSVADLSLLSNDYAFVFNASIAKKYKEYISSCKTIEAGSFKSNSTRIYDQKIVLEGILYISTFRLMYLDQDKITSGILCHDYIRNELVFLRWLFQFAQTEKIPLTILGKLDEEHDAEKAYYDDLSNKISFNYIKNYPGRNTYKIIDQVELVVSLDSSLGYEALSRGKKVAIFPGIRGDSYPLNTRNFCWPSNQVKNTGHFWTNSVNENQWNTVLQYVVSATSEQWNNDCDRYINQAIAVDRNNSQFCTLLEKMDLSK